MTADELLDVIAPTRADLGGVADADMRDMTSAVYETCSALSLSLRTGDLPAAERLFGFLVDQVPDRRLLVSGVLQPLLTQDLHSSPPDEVQQLVDTCQHLLSSLRRPTANAGLPGALLFALNGELEALAIRMLAWVLDDVGVPVHLVLNGDWRAARQRACLGHDTVVCIATSDVESLRDAAPRLRALRPLRSIALLTGAHAFDELDTKMPSAVSIGASRIGEAADLVLHLRGPLTSAEAEVLRLAADGYTNWRIAHEIGISLSAVKSRLESGYAKLNASDRTHAVAIALRKRWIR